MSAYEMASRNAREAARRASRSGWFSFALSLYLTIFSVALYATTRSDWYLLSTFWTMVCCAYSFRIARRWSR